MSPFAQSLKEEERWLCLISELPYPNDLGAGKRAYIGPGRLPKPSYDALMAAGWRQDDEKFFLDFSKKPSPIPNLI